MSQWGYIFRMAKADNVRALRETERKYDAADTMELPDPAEFPGLATGSAAQEQHLEAVYFDTSDLRLVRQPQTVILVGVS